MTGALLSARELRLLVDSEPDLVLLDARANRADYDAGHLDGARYADLGADLSGACEPGADPARGGRHPLPRLETWLETLGRWGIAPGSRVVVYDDQSGANAAARAWWMLRSVGHGRVAVLDGGLDAARKAGIGTTSRVPIVRTAPPYPAGGWSGRTADRAEVDERRKDPDWVVLDVRSRPRFEGKVEPFDPVAGHIPGASNLPYAESLEGGVFRPAGELRAIFEEIVGRAGPERLVVHCGSGVTACHTLLALELAGLGGGALYVGSWSEWCRSGLPREPG